MTYSYRRFAGLFARLEFEMRSGHPNALESRLNDQFGAKPATEIVEKLGQATGSPESTTGNVDVDQ